MLGLITAISITAAEAFAKGAIIGASAYAVAKRKKDD